MKTLSWNVKVDNKEFAIGLQGDLLSIDGHNVELGGERTFRGVQRISFGKTTLHLLVNRIDEYNYEVWIKHHVFQVTIEDARKRLMKHFTGSEGNGVKMMTVRAPMPGLVTKLQVKSGDSVTPGMGLVILEAMKMENEIRSTINGVVKNVQVKVRATVDKGQPLLILETT